eukprot:g6832.t1
MNADELAKNPLLGGSKRQQIVQNLNTSPKLDAFPADYFDFVLNSVSVDYLIQPLSVFQEMLRVLKPNGRALNVFSNRFFPTKVIDFWLRSHDMDHCWLVGSYFATTGPGWTDIGAFDISPHAGRSDPLYVVQARKAPSGGAVQGKEEL